MVYIAKLKISTIFKLSKFSLREGPYMERGYVKVNFFYFGLNFSFMRYFHKSIIHQMVVADTKTQLFHQTLDKHSEHLI